MKTLKRGALMAAAGLVIIALAQGPADHIGLLPGYSSALAAEDPPLPVTIAYTLTNSVASGVITLNPTSLHFTAVSGGLLPVVLFFTIATAPASSVISWSVSDDASWLEKAPESGGSHNSLIAAQPNTTSLPADTYQATILVHSNDATNSPQGLAVTYVLSDCVVAQSGDVNVSGSITTADVIYMVNYVYKSGIEPQPCAASGDVNCSGTTTSSDIIYLVNHAFKSGPLPCNVCSILGPGSWACP